MRLGWTVKGRRCRRNFSFFSFSFFFFFFFFFYFSFCCCCVLLLHHLIHLLYQPLIIPEPSRSQPSGPIIKPAKTFKRFYCIFSSSPFLFFYFFPFFFPPPPHSTFFSPSKPSCLFLFARNFSFIYIYLHRERERERETENWGKNSIFFYNSISEKKNDNKRSKWKQRERKYKKFF